MSERILSEKCLTEYENYLTEEEKSEVTIEKYLHDVRMFSNYMNGEAVAKSRVLDYKKMLTKKYAPRSVNSMLAALNSLFSFMGWEDCKVKNLKLQREIYTSEERELTRAEYLRLLQAAGKNSRLHLMIETICGTGIRVSELQYFTVEKVKRGTVTVRCKNKTRSILIPSKLRRLLLAYARQSQIKSGIIFRTRTGKPVDRSNIWLEMKKLCKTAQVSPKKVFPHNLRKLFARTFYEIEKDIAKLADILGHSNIETTRIYVMTTGLEHRKRIDRMRLVI